MSQYQVKSPVALIVFNRPGPTRKVFDRIAAARPGKLLVIADGPRTDVDGEAEKCARTREIIDRIDWDCDLSTNFSDVNLGCRVRVASGLDWIFRREDRAIILEDDCIPTPEFFRYCDELLERYRDEPRVMTICGTNHLGKTETDTSYLFTTHMSIWGWATWRRAYESYDVDLKSWTEERQGDPFEGLPLHREEVRRLRRALDNLSEADPARRKGDTWDWQWIYNCYASGGLAVTPRVNLVSNVGFGPDATHTTATDHKLAEIPTGRLGFPLTHPRTIEPSVEYDRMYYERLVRKTARNKIRNFFRRIRRRLGRNDPKSIRQQLRARRDSNP